MSGFPRAVLFDLLTALLDSWTLWNSVAGGEEPGRAWRAEYLRLTYGSDAYVPYEDLVWAAARNVGLPGSMSQALQDRWLELQPWPGAQQVLDVLSDRTKLALVTNCSNRLGLLAAGRFKIRWSCVITAEAAGYYKPNPRPYSLALETLEVDANDAAFVAGSGFDLIGTSAVGLRTYWHNRVGLKRPADAPAPELESSNLTELVQWLEGRLH